MSIGASCRPSGLLLLAALWAGPVRAQTVPRPPEGTEALARGGAFAARADTPLALSYNVAGLAQVRGTQVLADLHLSGFGLSPCASTSRPEPCYGPTIAISSDLGVLRRWTLGVGLTTAAPLMRYPLLYLPGLLVPRTFLLEPQLGAAVRVTRRLHLGLSVEDVVALSDCPSGARCLSQGIDALNLMFQLGALLRAGEHVSLGISLRTANNLNIHRDDETGKPRMPWLVRLGARYGSGRGRAERYDAELDFVYQGYSPLLYSIQHFFGLHLGGSVSLSAGAARLALRLGAYTQLAKPEEYPFPRPGRSDNPILLRVDDQRFGATCGMGIGSGPVLFNLAYGFEYIRLPGFGKEDPKVHTLSAGLLLRFGTGGA